MIRYLLIITALILIACDPTPAPTDTATHEATGTASLTPEPSATYYTTTQVATNINPVFQTSTVQSEIFPATQAAIDAQAKLLPANYACTWMNTHDVELRIIPESRAQVVLNLRAGGSVRLTGRVVDYFWEPASYVEVDRVNGLDVDALWVEFERHNDEGETTDALLFPYAVCNVPGEPTPETFMTATPTTTESWTASVNVNIRPTCSTSQAAIGKVEAGKAIDLKPGIVPSTDNIEWRMLADAPGCVAVRSGSTVLMVKAG